MFLESETFNADKRDTTVRSSGGSFMKGLMGISGDSSPTAPVANFIKSPDADAFLEDKREHLESLEKQLKALQKALDVLVKQRMDLALTNSAFGESLTMLSSVERDGPLKENLQVLGGIQLKIRELHEKQVCTVCLYKYFKNSQKVRQNTTYTHSMH